MEGCVGLLGKVSGLALIQKRKLTRAEKMGQKAEAFMQVLFVNRHAQVIGIIPGDV